MTTEIIQYWDSNVPAAVAELLETVKSNNPDCAYVLFDDDSAAEFIESEFSDEVLRAFHTCAIPAMRADLFRYCYLLRRGGFYLDADFYNTAGISPMIRNVDRGCCYMRERGLTNSMMYVRFSGDPLLQAILDVSLSNIDERVSNNVWAVTGPAVMQQLYAEARTRGVFEGYHFVTEPEFGQYFRLAPCLDYKQSDSHWSIARDKGLSIYRD